jgi:phytoene synthase
MFDGQMQDLQPILFHNFAELYQYCYRVASSVGLICIKIWGYEGGKMTEQLAEYQGVAFQLTNILRDVTVDSKLGRDYFPGGPHTKEQLDSAIRDIIIKTADYYDKSNELVKYLHSDGRASLRAMTSTYYHIFLKLKAHPERIPYQQPIKLPFLQKIWYIFVSLWYSVF